MFSVRCDMFNVQYEVVCLQWDVFIVHLFSVQSAVFSVQCSGGLMGLFQHTSPAGKGI